MDNSRYQFKTQRYSSHSQLIQFLKQKAAPISILEAGIADGYIGKSLAQYNFQITGIEKEKSLTCLAKDYYCKILILDLNKDDLPFLEKFDIIILLDILEHLYDPLTILRKMHRVLKNNGQIMISVPNIANWVIRLRLAFGNFDYSERGILDKDHARFFTLKTIRRLIQEANFEIINHSYTTIPFEFFIKPVWLSSFINEIYYFLTKPFPKFFAYQFMFIVTKAKAF